MKNSKSKKDKEKEKDTKNIQDIRTMFFKKTANTDSSNIKLDQSKDDIKMEETKKDSHLLDSNKKTRKAHEMYLTFYKNIKSNLNFID